MSSALRLSIVMVLLFAATALGIIAYNASRPVPVAVIQSNAQSPTPAPATVTYYVAAHALPVGALARDEDFETRAAALEAVPAGAILETPKTKVDLRGSLIRKYLDTGRPVTSQDVLRPRDRGFLASVLAPDTRAISINVDAESGVSGLIWPGDYVDVVLTQTSDKGDAAHRSLSEIVLRNVRIIAIDQEIVEGAGSGNTTAGKLAHSVSLELSPGQVKKITLAKDLGKLYLAIRAAVEQQDAADGGATFGCDVSPELSRQDEIARQNDIAGQSATVVVYSGEKIKKYAVKKHDGGDALATGGCGAKEKIVGQNADAAN